MEDFKQTQRTKKNPTNITVSTKFPDFQPFANLHMFNIFHVDFLSTMTHPHMKATQMF